MTRRISPAARARRRDDIAMIVILGIFIAGPIAFAFGALIAMGINP